MTEHGNIVIGSVVYSKAGRDAGSYYIVVQIENENFVRIADGKKHLLDKPKLKKLRHLKANGDILEGIAEKFREGSQVFDKEVYSALKCYNEEMSQGE